MTNGTRANRSGHRLEYVVGHLLSEKYDEVDASDFLAKCGESKPIYARQCAVGKDIYGRERRVDFILYHPHRWPDCLVIQCKWQSSRGSVDEKYPFEVLSTQESGYNTIIVLDGGGYSAGAERWLHQQAGKGTLLHIFNQGEISRFHSKGQL